MADDDIVPYPEGVEVITGTFGKDKYGNLFIWYKDKWILQKTFEYEDDNNDTNDYSNNTDDHDTPGERPGTNEI